VRHELVSLDDYSYREGTTDRMFDTPEPFDDLDLAAMHDELRRASAHAPVAFWGEDPDALLAPPHLGDLLRGTAAPRLVMDIVAYVRQTGRRPYLALRDLAKNRFGASAKGPDEGTGAPLLRPELRRRRLERLRSRAEPAHPTRSETATRLQQWHWQPFLESFDAGFHGVPVEVRLPFLDLRLIHFVLAVPPIPWMQRKHLLREAARGLIPDAVRLAPKRGLPGSYEARLRQWWDRAPAPFVPCEALARFVDVDALPTVDRSTPVNDAMLHLRLRILDRWLRANADSD
jgi:asparagine synthase (glutamine-hydrolysing)